MIGSDIIARFQLQVDDASELSSDEELELLNEVYSDICDDRDWEWLKVSYSANTSTTVPYIALPSDFKKLSPNKYNKSVVFVGTDYNEYIVIPFSDRRDYRDMDGYCYIDIPNSRLVFTKQPSSVKPVEFDYIKKPADVTASTEPIKTDSSFGKLITYGMAYKFVPIEQSEKKDSYRAEYYEEYLRMLSDLQMEDSQIKLSI